MSLQVTTTAGITNLILAGIFYRSRIGKIPKQSLLMQMSGIVCAALINSTRPYTEKHLKKWIEERHIDYVYGAASLLAMGLGSRLAKLPLKVSAVSSLVFTFTQLTSHKLCMTYFKDQLEVERLQGVKISDANLALYKDNTFEAGKYLIDQLFPTASLLYDRTKSCTASVYILPHGFMIMLSLNKGLPNFDFMGTCDGTEVDRLYCSSFHHLDLSDNAKSKLIKLSKQIQVEDANGIKTKEEWDLKGMPPFICMEGKWNTSRQPHGIAIDWESLILESSTQQHEAFELSLISPTWKHNPETPNLRGKSLNHSQPQIHFNIWVHEPNTNAFGSEDDAVTQRIENLKACLDFIRDFERAACLLKSTGSLPQTKTNTVDFDKLEAWANLTKQIPFPHDKEKYEELPTKVQEYKDSKDPTIYNQLLEKFQSLVTTLKDKIGDHPELQSVVDELEQVREAFRSDKILPKSKVFKGWQKKVKDIPEANTLVKELRPLAQEYPLSKDLALEAPLINLLRDFFDQLPRELHFGRDYAFHQCHQEYLSSGRDLVRSQGFIDPDKLQEWNSMLQIMAQNAPSNPKFQKLLAQAEQYLKNHNALRNPGAKPPAELDALRKQRAALDPLLKAGFQKFFHAYANQNIFVQDICQEIECLETKKRHLAIYAFFEEVYNFLTIILLPSKGKFLIDIEELKKWKDLLKLVTKHYHSTPELNQFITKTDEYLKIDDTLKNPIGKSKSELKKLRERRKELFPSLRDGAKYFFHLYDTQRTFAQNMKKEVEQLSSQKQGLPVFAFCKQGIVDFSISTLLLSIDGTIDTKKLEDCKEVLELCKYHTAPTIRPLLDQSQKYLAISRQLTSPLLQQSDLTRFTALTQQKTALEQSILTQYQWFFMTYIRGLDDKEKEKFFEQLANYTKCPRSHTKSTAQIEFEAQPNLTKLRLTLRRNRFSQVSNLLGRINSHLDRAENNYALDQELSDAIQAFCRKAQGFMVRKAQSLEIVLEQDWVMQGSSALEIEHSKKRSDGSKYRFKIEDSRLSIDLYRLLQEAHFLMGNQYTMVNQTNHAAYCKSPFLKEEVALLEELYAIVNALFSELKIPLQWNDHLRLHEKSRETHLTQKAIEAPTSYRVYKRIQSGGHVELDLLKKKDSSDLSTLEESHVALYTY